MIKERMPEVKTAAERKTNVVVVNSLEEYVRELSQRMILPKGKIENFKGILASPDQLAPLVEKTEDTRIELKVTTPSQTRFSISSEIKTPKNKEKLKTASRSVQLASLAEAEARFRAIRNSEHIPDQVRYAGFDLNRTISRLHKQSEKLVEGEKVFGKTKAEKKMGIIALSLAAAACGKIPIPIQPTSVEPVATEVAPTSIPTEEASPTPTETPPSYETEDGVQLEKQEEGEFVDLFPGSDVFMSERGDIVIINEETDLQLAGQVVETKYGKYTLLLADSYYQALTKYHLNETTILGGYPNLVDSPLKDEIGRIIFTLLQLKEKEIVLGSVNLRDYEPAPKNFIAIYMNPGNTSRLANSMPEGFIDPSEIKTIVANGEFGYPTIETQNNNSVLIRFMLATGSLSLSSYPEESLQFNLISHMRYIFRSLLIEAAVAQGTHDQKFRKGYPSVKESPFAALFSHPEINEAHEALLWTGEVRSQEELVEAMRKSNLGSQGAIEIDFDNFK